MINDNNDWNDWKSMASRSENASSQAHMHTQTDRRVDSKMPLAAHHSMHGRSITVCDLSISGRVSYGPDALPVTQPTVSNH